MVAKENAKRAKQSPKIKKGIKERKEAKTNHDRDHEIRGILETDLPLVDEVLHVTGAVQALPALVHFGSKIDLIEFAYFTTMGSVTNRLKIAVSCTTQHANYIPLLRVAEMETNVCPSP